MPGKNLVGLEFFPNFLDNFDPRVSSLPLITSVGLRASLLPLPKPSWEHKVGAPFPDEQRKLPCRVAGVPVGCMSQPPGASPRSSLFQALLPG